MRQLSWFSGKAGVQVGTEKAWELCDKYNLPRMVYVTEMDMDDASFRQVVEDLTVRYGKKIAPHFQPIRENEKLVGYINIIKKCRQTLYRNRTERRVRDSGLLSSEPEDFERFSDGGSCGDERRIYGSLL